MKTKLLSAALVALACFAPAHAAWAGLTFQLLYSFDSATTGANPRAGLTQGSDGNFYGTTSFGGASGKGTVFKITADGVFTRLRSFNGANGGDSEAALVQGSDGNFYGTTAEGGTSSACFGGCGTVFKITTNGTLTTLVSFNGTNGRGPLAGLVQGSNGIFYGTTVGGGAGYDGSAFGYGTVFQITTNGTLTTLFSFSGPDGSGPDGGLAQGSDGNFYGTTRSGGPLTNSVGTVFTITTNGVLTTLFSFTGADGRFPQAGLVQGNDGNFYGTTESGGEGYNPGYSTGCGTVFKITPSGDLTTLSSFDSLNGHSPRAGLVQGNDGNFYGTTYVGPGPCGGFSGNGTVFKITPTGTLTTLFAFDGTNGVLPVSGLMQGNDGNFYGTANQGGASGSGTIYRLVQPPRPVITAITRSNGTVTLTWTSVTNEIYRMEYKPSFAATSWTALTPDVTATGSTTSFTDDPLADTERYYRVVLLP